MTQQQIVADHERRPAGLGRDLHSCRSRALPDSGARWSCPCRTRRTSTICSRSRHARPAAIECRSRSWCTCARAPWDGTIYHKDLLPVAYVTGDMAGRLDSPLYGMFALVGEIAHARPDGAPIEQRFISQPDDPNALAVKWDGEWQITYETFRDMGLAYVGGPAPDLPAGGGAVRLLRAAADHHGAHSAHHHRRDARPCAARRTVHRHLDDRHDRARRHHRAQLDPAGGFHRCRAARRWQVWRTRSCAPR